MEVLYQLGELFNCIISLLFGVFSFLPPWVVGFVTSAFVVAIGIMIYKLIRG